MSKLPQKIKALADEQIAIRLRDLTTKSYRDFADGNQIPAYIYTKTVNVSTLGMTKMTYHAKHRSGNRSNLSCSFSQLAR